MLHHFVGYGANRPHKGDRRIIVVNALKKGKNAQKAHTSEEIQGKI